jgi:hypothetical protein
MVGQPLTFHAVAIGPLVPGTVEEVTPGDVLLGGRFFELLRRLITVHTDEREWLILQTLHERPLVREHGPQGGHQYPQKSITTTFRGSRRA